MPRYNTLHKLDIVILNVIEDNSVEVSGRPTTVYNAIQGGCCLLNL